MVEIINLRRARKAKERAQKDKTAQANRVLHGTPKRLRKMSEAEKDKTEQKLAGKRLEKDWSVGESRSDRKPDDK